MQGPVEAFAELGAHLLDSGRASEKVVSARCLKTQDEIDIPALRT